MFYKTDSVSLVLLSQNQRNYDFIETNMELPKIHHSEFRQERVLKTEPEKKTAKVQPDKGDLKQEVKEITYYEIPLNYEYDVPIYEGEGENRKVVRVQKVVSSLMVQGPEVYTSTGIVTTDKKYGDKLATVGQIFVQFDLKNTEVQQFVHVDPKDEDYLAEDEKKRTKTFQENTTSGFCERLYQHMIDESFSNGGKIGISATKRAGMEGAVTYPIYWAKNKQTNQRIEGKNPSRYYSLYSYGEKNSISRKEAMFCIPANNKEGYEIIPWNLLTNVDMKFIPLWNVKKIYIGQGKVSIQMEIRSGVITSVVRSNSLSTQSELIDSMRKNNNLVQNIRSQIEALTNMKARSSVSLPEPVNVAKNVEVAHAEKSEYESQHDHQEQHQYEAQQQQYISQQSQQYEPQQGQQYESQTSQQYEPQQYVEQQAPAFNFPKPSLPNVQGIPQVTRPKLNLSNALVGSSGHPALS